MAPTKKPRHRWPLLLALFLGVATWWGMGWWLSPRIYWERWYEPSEELQAATRKQGGLMSTVVWNGGKNKPGDVLREQLLDQTGRYLFLFASQQKKPDSYEVIDLHQRKSIAQYEAKAAIADALAEKTMADSQGKLSFIRPTYVQVTQPRARKEHVGNELAHWNLLTNEVKPIKSFSRQSSLRFCSDGSTLLEIEKVTPLPAMMFPTNLATFLGNQAVVQSRCSDLSILRVWSTSDAQLRCTIAMPWVHALGQTLLTYDGKYLVLPDANLPLGYASKEPARSISRNWSGGYVGLFIAQPKGIRVYDTQTGRLCSTRTGYREDYLNVISLHPDAIAFQPMPLSPTQERGCLLHLPTMQWHVGHHDRLATLDAEHVQFVENPSPGPASRIISIDRSGTRQQLADIHTQIWGMLPGQRQYFYYTSSRFVDSLPAWLADWLQARGILPAWTRSTKTTLNVVDYDTKQTVFSTTMSTLMHTMFDSTKWMVLCHYEGDSYHIEVYQLPFPSRSPWWARGAGIMMAFLCWLVLIRSPLPTGHRG